MAQLLKGLPVAKAIAKELSERSGLLNEKGVKPTLAILRVGSRPDDLSYEKGASKDAPNAALKSEGSFSLKMSPNRSLSKALRK